MTASDRNKKRQATQEATSKKKRPWSDHSRKKEGFFLSKPGDEFFDWFILNSIYNNISYLYLHNEKLDYHTSWYIMISIINNIVGSTKAKANVMSRKIAICGLNNMDPLQDPNYRYQMPSVLTKVANYWSFWILLFHRWSSSEISKIFTAVI